MKTYKDAVAFHGHSCPGLAMGYRVAKRALKELGRRAGDEELVVTVENSSCAVDAVQVVTGCTFGKGNLLYRDFGKQVYTFHQRLSGKGVRIAVIWEKPVETPAEKKMWDRYREGDRSTAVLRFVHNAKSSKVKQLLSAKDDKVLSVTKVQLPLPPEAKIFRSVACASCGEMTMEPRLRVLGNELLCIPCFERRS